MKPIIKYLLSFIIIIILIVLPLVKYNDHEFSGSDDNALNTITEINQDYEPWFDNILEINDEMESLFFTLQAVMGATIFGFCLGYLVDKKKTEI